MRKNLEVISAVMLAALVAVVVWFLFGFHPLSSRVVIHIGLAGRSTDWGSSLSLLILPAAGICNYFLLSWLARHPAMFNYPIEVTPQNHAQLEALSLDMLAWLKAEMIAAFLIVFVLIARDPNSDAAPFFLWIVLAAIFITLGWHLRLIFRLRPAAR